MENIILFESAKLNKSQTDLTNLELNLIYHLGKGLL